MCDMRRLVAISGGIGCGKSVVSVILGRLGYPVYDCDTRAKRLMDSSPEILDRLASEIHESVVIGGRIDRRRLSELVFSDADKLAKLNAIVHSEVRDDLNCWVKSHDKYGTLFVETAILYQSGLDKMVDEVWEVVAPKELRVKRVMSRNNCTAEDVESRIASQTISIESPHRSVHEIVNDGFTPLLPQIEALLSFMNGAIARPLGALFDLDGVLIDSEGLYTQFWSDIEKIYPTGITDFAHVIKGNALFKILNTYFPDPNVQADITRRVHEFEDEIRYPVYQGVREFLSSLRSRGFKTAVVTSSDNVKMASLWGQVPDLKEYFDIVITGSDVTRSKPDPQGYLLAARRLGCDPGDCYVFEDSFQGLEAGMASGATVIALATSNARESLKGKAHEIIDDFTGFTVDKLLAVSRDVSRL